MSSKHTPGPWNVAENDETITAGENGLHIAHIVTIGMGKQVKPNAHLIAAAPELVEALETLLHEYFPKDQAGPAIDKARAAIAKSKGEQS